MNFTIETEREDDGRWIAEVPELPGALAYGTTREEAMVKVEALALRVLAERFQVGRISCSRFTTVMTSDPACSRAMGRRSQ